MVDRRSKAKRGRSQKLPAPKPISRSKSSSSGPTSRRSRAAAPAKASRGSKHPDKTAGGRKHPDMGNARKRSSSEPRQRAAGSKVLRYRNELSPHRARTLLHLEDALGTRIVGKSEAIERIARVIRIRQSQLKFRAERPDGSFLLLGPPGVGKNEIAHALAEVLYEDESAVVSVDLGEIDDEEDLAKLAVTAIPGTDGHYLEGLLTSPIRENPKAVVLLRGLERAHPSFQRLLLQILDRGRIEDMLGMVDFSRTIIFVTMHLTREDLAPSEIGFGRPSRSVEQQRRVQLERYVSPDLLDAFNEVIELPPLTAPEVREIARYKVHQVLARMQQRRKEIRIADAVYDELIPENACVGGSAKFLNRTLEERLFNPLSRYLLSHRKSHDIDVRVKRGQIVIRNAASADDD